LIKIYKLKLESTTAIFLYFTGAITKHTQRIWRQLLLSFVSSMRLGLHYWGPFIVYKTELHKSI